MKVKVLLVMPGKEIQTVKIPASLKFIKAFIGEELYKIRLNSNIMLIANKNSNIEEFNRILCGNIILGTFLIIAIKNNRIVSLKSKDIRKYTNIFNRSPQRINNLFKIIYILYFVQK